MTSNLQLSVVFSIMAEEVKKKKMDYIVVINVLLLEKIRKAKCYENDNEI